MEIPIYYDPMISKLITYGKDRTEAIERMKRAIDEYQIEGIKTTLPFCKFVMDHIEFRDGSFTTKFVEQHYTPEVLKQDLTDDLKEVAAIFAYEIAKNKAETFSQNKSQSSKSGWKTRIIR